MKILTVVGTRPNFIKLAPLDRELRKTHTCITVHTGQHYDDDMSDRFFRDLGIPIPNYNLHISNISGTATHATQTGNMMIHLDRVISSEKPDLVIVYGDTNSTLAGALVAAKLNIPVAHVEAGCRSFDMTMPEEVNRVIVDSVSTLLFCPTTYATFNASHTANTDRIFCTGDVMADSVAENIEPTDSTADGKYSILTLHRPSNVDDPDRLGKILARVHESGIDTIFPVHPRTFKMLPRECRAVPGITYTEPLPYRRMLQLIQHAHVVVTDSGGIQKEAFMLHAPCLTIRDTTEWPETMEFGWNQLVCDIGDIPELMRNVKHPDKRPDPEPFQPGASRGIAKIISEWSME